MANNFGAQVTAWAAQTEKRLQATYRRSVELLGEEMSNTKPNGGRVPIDTGNLANSLIASTQGMPRISDGRFTGSNLGAVTATLKLGQPVWLGYQAAYARRMEYGFVGADSLGRVYNQAGNHFVAGAIANWQQIVTKAANELQSAVESRA